MLTPAKKTWLRLRAEDNVALALAPLAPGDVVEGVTVREAIPLGHKVALSAIPEGGAVLKYANLIAVAKAPIEAGTHVHVHNAGMPAEDQGRGAVKGGLAQLPEAEDRTFLGIRRPGCQVATRNYVGILTTVNCSATAARAIAARFQDLSRWPGVDGVAPLTHTFGCAMSPDSEGIRTLRRTLAGYANHPNFAGVLVIGLGCESNELSALLDEVGGESERVRAFDIQSTGGTAATISEGMRQVEALLELASANAAREPLPLSHLKLGLQCGGSDSFSGLSANPALGAAADLLVAHGGTAILSETPEIYGAEHLLLARASSDGVARKLEERVAWWRDHVAAHGATLNDNPSAGNIAGGITTILEKSLGAVAKAGASPLTGVFGYAEAVDTAGLVFMDSPGYDPVSVTGQVASGANLIAFTTGRGSTFGCKPVPSMKLATNSDLYRRMADDIDVNCGDIVEGTANIADKGGEIFEAIIAMASGEPTASERWGFGDAEFAPWVPGAIT
jgi:altronate hydrolase